MVIITNRIYVYIIINKNSPKTKRMAISVREILNNSLNVFSESLPSSFFPIFVPIYTDIINGNNIV